MQVFEFHIHTRLQLAANLIKDLSAVDFYVEYGSWLTNETAANCVDSFTEF